MAEMWEQPKNISFPKPRERVLDRFAQRHLFEKGADGTTAYERFLSAHPDIPSETKELLDFVIKKTVNVRMGVLKSVDYKKYEHAFQVLFLELQDREEFSEITDVLSRLYYVVLNKGISEGAEGEDIRAIIERYNQEGIAPKDIAAALVQLSPDVLRIIERDIHSYLLLFGERKYIVEIGKQAYGAKKLQGLLDRASRLSLFNGSHLSQIVVGAGWEDKLKYFEDPTKVTVLKDLGFNGYHLSQIVVGAGWEDKLKYLLEKKGGVKSCIQDRKISALLDILETKVWRKDAEAFLTRYGKRE